MIGITTKGDGKRTITALNRLRRGDIYSDLDRYGAMGVAALSRATPVDSSLTANSWAYRVIKDKKRPGIEWYNTNRVGPGGTPVAILIQYGHGTGTGGYVAGRDFINPAMRSIFDRIANDIWKKVRA